MPPIQIWDTTNRASINTDGTFPVRFGTANLGMSTFAIGGSALRLVNTNTTRYSVWLFNKGVTAIWLGNSSSVTAGVTGFNFGYLSAGSNVEFKGYVGQIWGIGTSGYFDLVGVADIG